MIFGATECTEKGEWMEKKELSFEEETFALRGSTIRA